MTGAFIDIYLAIIRVNATIWGSIVFDEYLAADPVFSARYLLAAKMEP
jgi:hypothetical protein